MEAECPEPVIIQNIALSKINMKSPELWFEISFLVYMEWNTEINIKVFELKCYFLVIWNCPWVNILDCFYIEFFQSWEMNLYFT